MFSKAIVILLVVAVMDLVNSYFSEPYTSPHTLLLMVLLPLIIARPFGRYRWRVRVLAQRNELTNHVMKARLEELRQAAKPPT